MKNVFDWFHTHDSIDDIQDNLVVLEKFLRIERKELRIEHFEEARKYVSKMNGVIEQAISSFNEEKEELDELLAEEKQLEIDLNKKRAELRKLKECPRKEDLKKEISALVRDLRHLDAYKNPLKRFIEKFSRDIIEVKDRLRVLHGFIEEEIFKNRVPEEINRKKEFLVNHFKRVIQIFEEANRDIREVAKYDRKYKKSIDICKASCTALAVTGELSNGWKLTNIQNVVIDLGGIVRAGSKHPIDISEFNDDQREKHKRRTIPLATSTPPHEILKQIRDATGVEKKVLARSFTKGELLAA